MSALFFAFLFVLFFTSFFSTLQAQTKNSIRIKATCTSDLHCSGTCMTSDGSKSAPFDFQATPETALEYPRTQEGNRREPGKNDTQLNAFPSLAYVCSFLHCCGVTHENAFYTNFDTTTFELKEPWALTKSALALLPASSSFSNSLETSAMTMSNPTSNAAQGLTGSQQQQQQPPQLRVPRQTPNTRIGTNGQAPILPVTIQPVNALSSSNVSPSTPTSSNLTSPDNSTDSSSTASSSSSSPSSSKKQSLLSQSDESSDAHSRRASSTFNLNTHLFLSCFSAFIFMVFF